MLEEIEQSERADGLDELRERLRGLDEAAIETAAFSFTSRDLRRMLTLLCLPEEDPVVVAKGKRILELRASPRIIRDGVKKLLAHFPVDPLEELLVAVLRRQPELEVPSEPLLQQAVHWLRFAGLCEGIVRAALETGLEVLGPWFEARGLAAYPNVIREVWKRLLRSAPQEFYQQHDPDELLDQVRSAPSELQITFAQRYLELLQTRSAWNEKILLWILERFGGPEDIEAMPRFWAEIREDVRREFRRWMIERQLADFFQDVYDPNGRFAFWKTFLDHIQNAKLSKCGSVALIDFGHFFVIEFARVGNAAYVYSKDQLRRFQEAIADPRVSQPWYQNAYLKDRRVAKTRIKHYSGWQWKYRPIIEGLIAGGQN
ncbi:MAG: hypothetical protein Kow00109_23570 [Acidobacteriota bacterium]